MWRVLHPTTTSTADTAAAATVAAAAAAVALPTTAAAAVAVAAAAAATSTAAAAVALTAAADSAAAAGSHPSSTPSAADCRCLRGRLAADQPFACVGRRARLGERGCGRAAGAGLLAARPWSAGAPEPLLLAAARDDLRRRHRCRGRPERASPDARRQLVAPSAAHADGDCGGGGGRRRGGGGGGSGASRDGGRRAGQA